jgi:hypothetical protein
VAGEKYDSGIPSEKPDSTAKVEVKTLNEWVAWVPPALTSGAAAYCLAFLLWLSYQTRIGEGEPYPLSGSPLQLGEV